MWMYLNLFALSIGILLLFYFFKVVIDKERFLKWAKFWLVMLYNKALVRNRVPYTRMQGRLASVYSPFGLDGKILERVKSRLKTYDSLKYPYDLAKKVTDLLTSRVKYDDNHKFLGIRSAKQTWKDKKGHCFEQNVLLYSILSQLGMDVGLLLVKNPNGYENGENTTEYGVHLFITFRHNRKTYAADAITGNILRTNTIEPTSPKLILTPREFVAFYMHDAAEDLSLEHGRHTEALFSLCLAEMIDPNNYPVNITKGDVLFGRDDFEKAENAHKAAVEIAPSLDTLSAYGDLLLKTRRTPEEAIRHYRMALKGETGDLQTIRLLKIKLIDLGELRLAIKAREREKMLLESIVRGTKR